MKKIIAVSSIKGGVGKTATTTFLSQVVASMDKRTLVIDCDPNNNLTDYFLREYDVNDIEGCNLCHFLTGDQEIDDVIYNAQFGLDIIPCTLTLHKIGLEMAGQPNGMLKFKRKIKSLDYDIIIIDTPPNLSYELRMALNSVDTVLTPVSFSRWTLQAISLLGSELFEIEQSHGECPELIAVPSIVTDSENDKLRNLDFNFAKTYIKKSASIKNAHDRGSQISENSKSWNNFCDLAKEII